MKVFGITFLYIYNKNINLIQNKKEKAILQIKKNGLNFFEDHTNPEL